MSYYVTTVAGSGTKGLKDGAALHSQFNFPKGIVIDKQGNVFIADRHNRKVRKLTERTVITVNVSHTLNSNPSLGYLDGLAIDLNSNVYIADSDNNAIKKYVNNETITIVQYPDKTFQPIGLCVDKDKIVITSQNSKIYEYDIHSNTLDSILPTTNFRRPTAIAVDRKGNLFVCETFHDCIRKISANRRATKMVTGCGLGFLDGHKSIAKFNRPEGLAFNAAGELFIADTGNHAIRKLGKDGMVTTLAGGKPGYKDGLASQARLCEPVGLAIDSDGNILFSDSHNHRIRKLLLRLDWNSARVIWIGHLKNEATECPLAIVPKDIIRVIIRYC